MKTRKPTDKQIRNERCEHHSNLALLTTVVAMIGLVVLMFVYMGDHNSANIGLVISASKYCAAAAWIGAAVFAWNAVSKKKKYLLEYIIYLLVLGAGLFFMYSMPDFVYELIKGTYLSRNWARSIFKVTAISLVVYSLVSLVWHVILATPRKSGKK